MILRQTAHHTEELLYQEIAGGTLRAIVREIGLTVEQFLELLKVQGKHAHCGAFTFFCKLQQCLVTALL